MAQRRRIRMTADARGDLRQAYEHYELQRQGLGRRFVLAVADAIDAIIERPGSFPQVYRDLRRSIVKRFPYGVFFRVTRDVVRVVAVLHLHRDPGTWRRRA